MAIENVEHNKKGFDDIRRDVMALLVLHTIPFEQWGTGSAKTLDHLLREIAEGETLLEVNESGMLVRKVRITYVDIYCIAPDGKRLKLVEEKQIFKDGRERRRILDGSIAEKLKATEAPNHDMVQRAISEELGIEVDVPVQTRGSRETMEDSPSYPGLAMQASNYHFDIELPGEHYKPEGYIEHQKDKDTYFVWIPTITR